MAERRPGNSESPRTDGQGAGGPERDALPPFAFRHRLIPAIQAIVGERFGGLGPDLSAVYAAVTVLSANAVLPAALPYSVQAGCVVVSLPNEKDLFVGPGGEAPSTFPVHAWAGRRHPSGRVEVADLSTRHFNAWFDRATHAPGGRFPRAVWAFDDEVPRAFRYVSDEAATEQVRTALRSARDVAVRDAAREVVELLGTCSG